MSVRVRIAPSPTGFAHIGTAHTALFNWLFARHHDGTFVVRIEDTDRNRLVAGAFESIEEMLRYLDIQADEGPYIGGDFGPYFQSERLDIYAREIQTLLANGSAYHCWCSSERLAAVNAEKQRNKQPPGYDRHCRFLSEAERAASEQSGVTPVVRLAVPLEGETIVHDVIRGDIAFQNALLQDAVLMKSDGYPTYHFAATVDDHLMQISHVMRGDEWINSTPLHVIINEAFGWQPPIYAHLPLLLGNDKTKLSKRHGDTAFSAFIKQGYLPEALINFLGLLGWSLDDKTEFLTREEFVEHFDLDRIVKNPAVFDFKKLNWMNGQYIRMLPDERLSELVLRRLETDLPEALRDRVSPELARQIAPLLKERLDHLDEIAPKSAYFFTDDVEYDRATLLGKAFADRGDVAALVLDEVLNEMRDVEEWKADVLLEILKKLAETGEIKLRPLTGLVRVAIAGSEVSLPLTESMEILGKRVSLHRLEKAVAIARE